MPETFGARLRQRREEQGIALVAIADETKIKLSLLEDLERDDVSHWPLGIFRRAYIRSYAHAIGLSPDAIVREFLEIYPDPPDVLPSFAVTAGDDVSGVGGPPTRFRYILGSALESLSRLRRSSVLEAPASTTDASIDRPAGTDRQPASPSADAARDDWTGAIVHRAPAAASAPPAQDLLALAGVCTEIGRATSADDLQGLLPQVARIVGAAGLIVWIWDASAGALRPALAHGYSDNVIAQLPAVSRNADNATAAAFRSGRACAIGGSDDARAALVVPLLTPAGCAGVLALERDGEQAAWATASATIVAAMLAQLCSASVAVAGTSTASAAAS